MKKLSRLLLVLTLVLLIGCTSVLLVACDDDNDQDGAPATPYFRVSFMKNYPEQDKGESFKNDSVRQGKTVGAYKITEDDRPAGYKFVGWYVGPEEGAEKFDFATKITQNVNVYAHWVKNGKSTKVDLKGGVFTPEKVKINTKEGKKEIDNGVWRYVVADNHNVIPHDNSYFDFKVVLNDLKDASKEEKTEFSVYEDEECNTPITNAVNLKNGDNFYYINAVAEDSKATRVYKINVYLEPKFDIKVAMYDGAEKITISGIEKGKTAPEPSIDMTRAGYDFDDWYYYSVEQRNTEGKIIDANGNILVKVGNKYYLADENGERSFAYEDANGRKVVLYNKRYYLTDKSGARTNTDIGEKDIYNRLDENGYPVYDEGTPLKNKDGFSRYQWKFGVNVVDREGIQVFGVWKTKKYDITLKFSPEDNDAKFYKTDEKKLVIGGVNFNSTASVIEIKINEITLGKNPEKPHATFAGWYYKDGDNEIEVVDKSGKGKVAFDFATFDFEKDIELVAKFDINTYKIVVNANDDAMMKEVTGGNDSAPFDKPVTLTATAEDGYKLAYWELNGRKHDVFGDNTTVTYKIEEKDIDKNKQITFTAVFKPKDINVTLVDTVDNHGKPFVVEYNSAVVIGDNAIPDVPKLSADGTQRFIGWYYIADDGTRIDVVQYDYETNKNKVVTEKWTNTKDITLIADWSAYKFNITIYKAKAKTAMPDADMGDISYGAEWDNTWERVTGNIDDYELEGYKKSFNNGAKFTVAASLTDATLYTFKYWKRLSADGTLSKDEIVNGELEVTVQEQDVAYVAIWVYNPVKVTFDSGDKSVDAPAEENVEFNQELTLPIPVGAPSEMAFAGWWKDGVQYTGADGKSYEYNKFNDPELIRNGITLTAKWIPIEYFIINNGVVIGIDENKVKGKTEFTINSDDEVFAIASGAFRGNKFIKKITIKGNIQSIGEEAFANSNIEQIVFDGNFKGLIIGEGAFRNCVKITEIMLPDNVEQLDDYVFDGCSSLKKLAYSAAIPLGRLFTTKKPSNNSWYAAKQGNTTYYLPIGLKEIVVTKTTTAIADYAFQNAKQLTIVTLATKNDEDKPYTTKIGNYAFANTGSITVNLGSVEIIGNSAFRNSGVATVEFSALKKLGADAFSGSSVTAVDFSLAPIDNIPTKAFAMCASLKSVNLDGIKTISMSAFANSGLESVSNGSGVKTIKTKAFFKSKISSVSEFVNVENIEKEAFHDTQYFTNSSGILIIGKVLYYDKGGSTFTVDGRVVSIAPEAFKNSNFTTVDLSGYASLKYIESYAFAGNTKIKQVLLPGSLTDIKENAFSGSGVEELDFLKCINLKTIWQNAFENCKSLNKITFATFASTDDMAVKLAINDYAFSGCINLTDVNMPENLEALGKYAFRGCTKLKTVNFISNKKFNVGEEESGGTEQPQVDAFDPTGLIKEIGDGAFMGCTSLTTITLPYFIETIGNSAFEKCISLTEFTTMKEAGSKLAALRTIGARAFFGCTGLTTVDENTTTNVGENNTGIGESAFENCESLTRIYLPYLSVFSEGVFRNAKSLSIVDMGVDKLFYARSEAFKNCVSLTDIKATILGVDDGAFMNCVNIRTITFASGIEYIGNNAFNGCVLIQNVAVPATVVAIGDSAFSGCRGISTLTFGAEVENKESINLMSIGNSAFSGCALLKKVELPASITIIDDSAFYDCADLGYIEIGENIQSIGADAFALCKNGIIVRFLGKTVPAFTGDIFTLSEKEVEGETVLVADGTISVRQGYKTAFETALGTKYTIVEYTA